MRNIIKILWTFLCIAAGAAIFGILLGLGFNSWPLAACGGVIGMVLGWLFAGLVSPVDFLLGVFG